MSKFLLSSVFAFLFVPFAAFCQLQPVDVFESTLKVAALGSEEFYYGFHAGDQLVLNFEEVKGKELKEFEIVEFPGSSKFMDYKTVKIKDKIIQIQNTGIYKFRLANSAISGRIYKVKLQRIPANEQAKNFNSTVNWRTLYDTTYTVKDEKYLISRDTTIETVIPHRAERVHSQTANNGMPNRSVVTIDIPANTISWSYYLGVGQDSEECFRKAEEKAKQTRANLNAASSLANGLAKVDPTGSAAMASLALKGISYFAVDELANNIRYTFTDRPNTELFLAGSQMQGAYDYGNGPLSYKKMTSPLAGPIYLCLLNDNIREGIDVHIRVSAVTVKENWGVRQVQYYSVAPRQEPYLSVR